MSRYTDALQSPNVRAFLATIRAGEGTTDPAGYRRLFGGELVERLDDHPRRTVTRKFGAGTITSTAAGAYQFLSRTWDECAKALGLVDFSQVSQDSAAVFLIDRRKALEDVLAGRIEDAIRKCNREWASLPGSPYGQPTRTLNQALAVYASAGGVSYPSAPVVQASSSPKETKMPLPLFVAAALPSIIEMIPKLGKLFGSGSAVAERNVAAAQLAASVVAQAIGAKNEQETVEILRSDPAQVAIATAAVESRWFDLAEAGGGGIDGARKQDALYASGQAKFWMSPSFWAMGLLLPIVYLITGAMVGLYGHLNLSAEVTASIITGIVTLIIGGSTGYYFGSATSKNKPAESMQ